MTKAHTATQVFRYFLTLVLLSIPFFVIGEFVDLESKMPIPVPISALMFVCPAIALLFVRRRTGRNTSLKSQMEVIFDFKNIRGFFDVLVVLLIIPAIMFAKFWIMKLAGIRLPEFEAGFFNVTVLFGILFIAATFEELGWTNYLAGEVLHHSTIFKTGILIGSLWAIWHIIPYLQNHKSFKWIFWQCFSTILLRIIMVWVYMRRGKSLFLIILFHAMLNMGEFCFPRMGSHYDPFYFSLILSPLAIALLFVDKRYSPTKYVHR